MKRVPLFVLNNFLKFERKIYQVFGLKLGRPLSFKMVLYAIFFGIIEIIIYNLPIIGSLINWLPFAILVMIPALIGWLLSDVGTEGRSPIFFFRSFLNYQKRKWIDKNSLYRGRWIPKGTNYQFRNYLTFREPISEVDTIPFIDSFEGYTGQNQGDYEHVSSHETKSSFLKNKQSKEEQNHSEDSIQSNPSIIEESNESISVISEEKEIPSEQFENDIAAVTDITNTKMERVEDITDTSKNTSVIADVTDIENEMKEVPLHDEKTIDIEELEVPTEPINIQQEDSSLSEQPKKEKQNSSKQSLKNDKSEDQPNAVKYAFMVMRYRSKMKAKRKKG